MRGFESRRGHFTIGKFIHTNARFMAKGWGRRIVAVALTMAMLALMAAAVACDPEEGQPTDAPPTVREILDAFTVAQTTVETNSLDYEDGGI